MNITVISSENVQSEIQEKGNFESLLDNVEKGKFSDYQFYYQNKQLTNVNKATKLQQICQGKGGTIQIKKKGVELKQEVQQRISNSDFPTQPILPIQQQQQQDVWATIAQNEPQPNQQVQNNQIFNPDDSTHLNNNPQDSLQNKKIAPGQTQPNIQKFTPMNQSSNITFTPTAAPLSQQNNFKPTQPTFQPLIPNQGAQPVQINTPFNPIQKNIPQQNNTQFNPVQNNQQFNPIQNNQQLKQNQINFDQTSSQNMQKLQTPNVIQSPTPILIPNNQTPVVIQPTNPIVIPNNNPVPIHIPPNPTPTRKVIKYKDVIEDEIKMIYDFTIKITDKGNRVEIENEKTDVKMVFLEQYANEKIQNEIVSQLKTNHKQYHAEQKYFVKCKVSDNDESTKVLIKTTCDGFAIQWATGLKTLFDFELNM